MADEMLDSVLSKTVMEPIDVKSRLGTPRSPIRPVKKKEERAALLTSMTMLEPLVQLRLCLAVGTRPPVELLTSQHISSALQLDDCWKFARLLAVPERSIDALAVLTAARSLMQTQGRPNVRRWARGLLSFAKLWQTGIPRAVPTEATAGAFLSVAASLLDHRAEAATWSMGKSAPPKQMLTDLVQISLELTKLYPTVGSLTLGSDLLTRAVNRHSFDPDALSMPPEEKLGAADALWIALSTELDRALVSIRLSDVQALLRAMASFPAKQREFGEVVATHLAKPDSLDRACVQVLSQYAESTGGEDTALEFAPGLHEDVETTELARLMMKAWDVAARLAPGGELAEEVTTTLSRLFGLKLIGEADQTAQYHPAIHEFEHGAGVSDVVRVVRPGVQRVTTNKSSVIFKAVVRAATENSNV